MASAICQRCGSCPLEACPEGVQSPGSLELQLEGQLGFLASYSCHNLLRIETPGEGTTTRGPQGQIPVAAGAISGHWPKGKLSLKV